MEEHNNQQIQQLIEDPAFRAWCFGESSAEKEQYWKCWIAKNEDQRQAVHIARLVVLEFADIKEPFSAAKKK